MLGDLIWSVPVNAPSLVEFWKKNFRTQAEARIGMVANQIGEFQGSTVSLQLRDIISFGGATEKASQVWQHA
jgi:hypothetical protein